MKPLFHPISRLSMSLCAGVIAMSSLALSDTAAAKMVTSPYFGRWTVEDPNAPFSARGREYKTFDVAACGKDFCGVSVSDNGKCGPILFRFLDKSRNKETLKGHGKWGKAKKNVVIYTYDLEDGSKTARRMMLYLGDGYDLGGRSGNMPKFEAEYIRTNAVKCTVRA